MAKKVNEIIVSWSKDGKIANGLVTSAINASNKMHDVLNAAALSAAYQILRHKNSSPMIRLMTGLDGKAIYVKSLVQWTEATCKVTVSQDKATKEVKIAFGKSYVQLEEAAADTFVSELKPFWVMHKVPSAFNGFDYDAELAKLNKKAQEMARAIAEGTIKVKGEIVELTPDQIDMINLGSFTKAKHVAVH